MHLPSIKEPNLYSTLRTMTGQPFPTPLNHTTTIPMPPIAPPQPCSENPPPDNTAPTQMSHLIGQLNQLTTALDDRSSSTNQLDEPARHALLNSVTALHARLQSPWEILRRFALSTPATTAALKVCVDLDLFRRWRDAESSTGNDTGAESNVMEGLPNPQTPADLATMTGASERLIRRLLHHLSTMHLIHEHPDGSFVQTPFTLALTQPSNAAWVTYAVRALYPAFCALPAHLQMRGYTDDAVGDARCSPFVVSRGAEGSTIFEYYAREENRGEAAVFMSAMGGKEEASGAWCETFPSEALFEHFDKDSPLLVDIGGGVGHDIARFRRKHVGAGVCVLQDLPNVVANAVGAGEEGIEVMMHDFFEAQPVNARHARAYLMNNVLHDWSDERCKAILRHVREAMRPGYSRLLVVENVVGRGSSKEQVSTFDMAMMVIMGARERTEGDWRVLLAGEGFRVVKVWEGIGECVLECVSAEV